jgi:hypothetical protein
MVIAGALTSSPARPYLRFVPTVNASAATDAPLVHDIEFRVRYAETDQMGVVYHTN